MTNSARRPLRFVLFMLCIIAGGGIVSGGYVVAQKRLQAQTNQAFDNLTQNHIERLSNNIETSSDLLYGTRGLFAATNVNDKAWQSYISHLDPSTRYPGMKAVAYAQASTTSSEVTLKYHYDIASKAAQSKALGFVVSSEAKRAKALETATRTKQVSATAPIRLATTNQPGLLLLLPIFESTGASDKPAGYSIVTFETRPMIEQAIGWQLAEEGTSLTIEDISDGGSLLYEKKDTAAASNIRSLSREVTMEVANRTWRLTFQTPSSNLTKAAGRYAPLGILLMGSVLVLTACVIAYAVKIHRRLANLHKS